MFWQHYEWIHKIQITLWDEIIFITLLADIQSQFKYVFSKQDLLLLYLSSLNISTENQDKILERNSVFQILLYAVYEKHELSSVELHLDVCCGWVQRSSSFMWEILVVAIVMQIGSRSSIMMCVCGSDPAQHTLHLCLLLKGVVE